MTVDEYRMLMEQLKEINDNLESIFAYGLIIGVIVAISAIVNIIVVGTSEKTSIERKEHETGEIQTEK